MTIEDVLKVWKATPFRSFSLCLSDGRRFLVSRPDFIARSPDGSQVAVALSDDSSVFLQVSNVTDIVVHANRKGKKNGRKKT